MVGRRGHVQAAFTIKELRELSRIEGTRVLADPEELRMGMTEASAAELVDARPKKRLTDLVQSLAEPSPSGVDVARVVGLRFLLLPKAILPDPKRPGHVGSILMQRARLEGPAGKQVAVAGEGTVEIPCQMVLRSIGYKSLALPGLPFDKRRSVVANEKGRVMQSDGAQVRGTGNTGGGSMMPTDCALWAVFVYLLFADGGLLLYGVGEAWTLGHHQHQHHRRTGDGGSPGGGCGEGQD